MTPDDLARLLATPAGYAYIKLRMDISSNQKAMLQSFWNPSDSTNVSCCLCNGAGKTRFLAVAFTLFALDILNARVMYTSSTWKQISTQFLSEIKLYSSLFPEWVFLDDGIKIDGIPRLICLSTEREADFQGQHTTNAVLNTDAWPLIMITDESQGLPESVFRAIDRCHPKCLIVLGSPLGTDNYFYKIESDPNVAKFFKHFKVTQFECPWIPKVEIDKIIQKWGPKHEFVLSSVYAEFSQDSDNSIISLRAWNNCINNPPSYTPNERRVALDFAAGNDSNCIAYRNGNKIEVIKVWTEKDTMTAAGEILIELQRLAKTTGLKPSEVIGDASGLGKPIMDRLAEWGWQCYYFFGQAKPQDENYANAITECWLELGNRIVSSHVILPNNEDLCGQLISRKRRINSSGKLELEKKEEMKKRGMSSPDIADAVAMTYANIQFGIITEAAATYQPQPRTYKMYA